MIFGFGYCIRMSCYQLFVWLALAHTNAVMAVYDSTNNGDMNQSQLRQICSKSIMKRLLSTVDPKSLRSLSSPCPYTEWDTEALAFPSAFPSLLTSRILDPDWVSDWGVCWDLVAFSKKSKLALSGSTSSLNAQLGCSDSKLATVGQSCDTHDHCRMLRPSYCRIMWQPLHKISERNCSQEKTKTATILIRGGAQQFIDEAARSLNDSLMILGEREQLKSRLIDVEIPHVPTTSQRDGIFQSAAIGSSMGSHMSPQIFFENCFAFHRIYTSFHLC